MLKEIRKSFSCSKKKTKRILVNECLIKQSNNNHQLNELEPIEAKAQFNSITNPKKVQVVPKINNSKSITNLNPNQIMINSSTQNKTITKFKTKTNANSITDLEVKEECFHNRDDRTIDSTQQNKLHRNSSHGTFSINKLNISSGSFNRQSKLHDTNTKVQRQLLNNYLLSISKDFWKKDLQLQKEEFYQNYENNINMFEGWIQQIKSEGFEVNSKELNNKKNIVNSLEEKVSQIKKQLMYSKKEMGAKDVRLVKYQTMIQQENDIIEKNKAERAMMNQEINDLRKENQLFPSQTELTKEETRILNEQVISEKNNIAKITIDIQQCNTKISNVIKEKEILHVSLKVLTKQIEAYRLKITNTYQKSSNFMIDVNNLVNDNRLFYK